MDIIKIGVIGITGIILALQLKQYKSELSICVVLAVCIIMMFYSMVRVNEIVYFLKEIQQELGIKTEYLKIFFKITGIAYVSNFMTAICKDAGYQAIGIQIEIFGKVCIIITGIPVFLALLEAVKGILTG